MQKYNWNYPTTMWVGENRINDIAQACKTLNISKPLLVTDKVLELENRHFGALAGQGLVNIKLENYEKAIESYKRAQEIYPAMQSPKIMIEQIEQLIKQQLI